MIVVFPDHTQLLFLLIMPSSLFTGISCGAPQAVMGAEYLPTVPCYGYGCSFTLSCKEKYELIGASDNSSDNVVRCGVQQHGIWDFGNLACIGKFCWLLMIGFAQA